MNYSWSFILALFLSFNLNAQYAPAAGQAGSTALHKDSVLWADWGATPYLWSRGPQDISQPQLGLASNGQPAAAAGPAGDGTVFSLGDGGQASYYIHPPIIDGTGPDFAIFENGFSDSFLELAFVEVSSNGLDFVRFPAVSLTDTAQQIGGFGALEASKIHNLAGKYRANYGTPFDLSELADSSRVDINNIAYVRIVDVVGHIGEYGSDDSRGRVINDPWPTPFPSSGFDLDALGVIHQRPLGLRPLAQAEPLKIWPNPLPRAKALQLSVAYEAGTKLYIYNMQGQLVKSMQPNGPKISLPLAELPAANYIIGYKGQFTRLILLP